jgi:hypothetical protein
MKECSIYISSFLVLCVLDSSVDVMKIMIYLDYWHQDHRLEDNYIILDDQDLESLISIEEFKIWL